MELEDTFPDAASATGSSPYSRTPVADGFLRLALELAYDGTRYGGWQRQPNTLTVQEVVEDRLRMLVKYPELTVVASGRTDAGVHAECQWVHLDIPLERASMHVLRRLVYQLNCTLPPDIAARRLCRATPTFHARFDALSRAYRYDCVRSKWPFAHGRALPVFYELDLPAMQQACDIIRQTTDFATFCKLHGNNKTTLCTIHEAFWVERPPFLRFHIRANRFLRGMVRATVGTLLDVGRGRMSLAQFEACLQQADRRAGGENLPPDGLYLTHVTYPEGSFAPL